VKVNYDAKADILTVIFRDGMVHAEKTSAA
jgi:uncharacterized protein YuzE